jgi:hypothetical protein
VGWLHKHLEAADTDVLREMVLGFVQALMGAEAERSPVAVVAECYVRGCRPGGWRGWWRPWGIQSLSKSQVSELAKTLDSEVAAFRARPLDAGLYAYVWVDALAVKCREAGRILNVACVVATGVNADGYREILGADVLTSEDGAGRRFCVTLSPAACPGWNWWSLTPMPGSRGQRGGAARLKLAAVPDPLHPQPAVPDARVGPEAGRHAGAVDLRPAGRSLDLGSARPGGRAAHRAVPPGSRATRRRGRDLP